MSSRKLFLLRSCVAAACLWLFAAVAAGQGPQGERVFSGKLGEKYRIQMRLRREGEKLSGTYFYERVGQNLSLRGKIDAQGSFTLREYDAVGAQTGVFKGRWRPLYCVSCGGLFTGEWSKPDGTGSLPFDLTVYAVAFRGPLKLVTRSFTEKNGRGQPSYEISVQYPQLVGSAAALVARFNKMIRSKVTQAAAGYRKDFDVSGGSEFDLSYGVLANDDFISVDFIYYFDYGGGVQQNVVSDTVNYDLRRGRTIKLKELFRPGSDYKKLLSDYCLRALGEPSANSDVHLERVGGERKWTITPDGLDIIFDWGDFGLRPSAGETRVTVPYSVLRRVIRPGGPLAAFAR